MIKENKEMLQLLNKTVRVLLDKDFEDIDFIEKNEGTIELFLYHDYNWLIDKNIIFTEDYNADEYINGTYKNNY